MAADFENKVQFAVVELRDVRTAANRNDLLHLIFLRAQLISYRNTYLATLVVTDLVIFVITKLTVSKHEPSPFPFL